MYQLTTQRFKQCNVVLISKMLTILYIINIDYISSITLTECIIRPESVSQSSKAKDSGGLVMYYLDYYTSLNKNS